MQALASPDAAVLGQLEERVARMEALAKQQQDGTVTAHASTVRRKALRRRLHHELLRHLVTVADIAAGEQPGLAEWYAMPSTNMTNEAFRTHARRLLEQVGGEGRAGQARAGGQAAGGPGRGGGGVRRVGRAVERGGGAGMWAPLLSSGP